MKKKTITLNAPLLAMASGEGHFHNPILKYIKFVLLDDKPSGNGWGIEHEDFGTVSASAVGTPIKMRFLGTTIGNHYGSIPIGHITDTEENTLEDGTHQLIANGIVYASEYPEEVEWLQDRLDNNEPPGISYEMDYESKVNKSGTDWLKNLMTRAATFVRTPAYGTRTALLALASDSDATDEQLADGLLAIAGEIRPRNTNKGGNTVDEKELEQKIVTLTGELEAANTKISDLTTANAELNTEKENLTTERDTLQTKNQEFETALATAAREKLITARTTVLAEAGVKLETDAEKLQKKQEFWASMDESVFNEYVSDIKDALKVNKTDTKLASLRTAHASAASSPRINPDTEGVPSISALRERFSGLARNVELVEEE